MQTKALAIISMLVCTALMAEASVIAETVKGPRALQRRFLCGIFGSCATISPQDSPVANPRRARAGYNRALINLALDPVGHTRQLSAEQLQEIFRPVRFLDGIPVFRHGFTSQLILQSALRNYGQLYYIYGDSDRGSHLIRLGHDGVDFRFVSIEDEARLLAIASRYRLHSGYLRYLRDIL